MEKSGLTDPDSISRPHIMIHAITAERLKSYSATDILTNRDGFSISVWKTGSIFILQKIISFAAEAEEELLQQDTTPNGFCTAKERWNR
jgi:hypothetical protein